jgi:hypothetical protein
MVRCPMGLRPEIDCAGEAQLQLQITDSSSRQRGRPIIRQSKCQKIISKEMKKKIGRGFQMLA